MPSIQRIAIVGGGPAGAHLAEKLALAGREVLLFDEKLAWEKPCGGGLTEKALARWPFVRDAKVERNWIRSCELIAPSRRKVSFGLDRQIAIFSRRTLNGLLLERAAGAGAALHRERVTAVEAEENGWRLRSPAHSWRAQFIVLATGARNSFCQFAEPLGKENLMIAAGYYIPGSHDKVQIQFVKDLEGYIWVFPRADHFSAGICGRMAEVSSRELRALLESSLSELGLEFRGAPFYAHIIPSLSADALQMRRLAGKRWAIIGDAAGFVDPITGEGLYYALASAELLARALLLHAPEAYPAFVRRDFLGELQHAARIAHRFYRGTWMGGPVIERMVQLTARSPRFRELMRDLFAGEQEYERLRQRLYRSLPRVAAEALINTLWSQKTRLQEAGGVA
jgi:flavin-dependent dehydrogenase